MNPLEKLAAAQEAITALEQAGRISVLNWMFIADDELPDDEIRVYVAISDRDGPVEAYHAGEHWVEDVTGEHLQGVYAWAHIPELPPVPSPVVLDEEDEA